MELAEIREIFGRRRRTRKFVEVPSNKKQTGQIDGFEQNVAQKCTAFGIKKQTEKRTPMTVDAHAPGHVVRTSEESTKRPRTHDRQ